MSVDAIVASTSPLANLASQLEVRTGWRLGPPAWQGGRHLAGCPGSATTLLAGRDWPQMIPRDQATDSLAAGPHSGHSTAALTPLLHSPPGSPNARSYRLHHTPVSEFEHAGWTAGSIPLMRALCTRCSPAGAVLDLQAAGWHARAGCT